MATKHDVIYQDINEAFAITFRCGHVDDTGKHFGQYFQHRSGNFGLIMISLMEIGVHWIEFHGNQQYTFIRVLKALLFRAH